MSLRQRIDYRKCEKCGGRRPLDPGHQAILDICRDLVVEKKSLNAANIWPLYRKQPRHTWPHSVARANPAVETDRPPPTLHNMLADLVRLGLLARRKGRVHSGRHRIVFYEIVKQR